MKPQHDYNSVGKPFYTDNQKSRSKLWEFAHSKEENKWHFKAPRIQPSFYSHEVMKSFSEEAIKNYVEAKLHIIWTILQRQINRSLCTSHTEHYIGHFLTLKTTIKLALVHSSVKKVNNSGNLTCDGIESDL